MDRPPHAAMARLLVEDDEAVRESLHLLLSSNYDIDSVGDAASALATARRRYQNWYPPYDALLIDLSLGAGPDGFECLSQLRRIPGYSCAPALAFTGWSGAEVEARCRAFGFADVLIKPFMPEDLERRLEQVFSSMPVDYAHLTVA